MRKSAKKLILSRETLRNIDAGDLGAALGAADTMVPTVCFTVCVTNCAVCHSVKIITCPMTGNNCP